MFAVPKSLHVYMKSFPHLRQNDVMECGTTCLAIIFKHYGYYDIRNFLSQYAEVDTEGIDLYTLSEIAEEFGFETNGYQLEYQNLLTLTTPSIVHYEGNHFVVVYKVTKGKVWISDPASGKYTLTKEQFLAKWNGIVLELMPNDEIFKHNEVTELANEWRENRKRIWHAFYRTSLSGTAKYLKWILASTLCLLVLSLMLPFFTQAIIDNVIANRNLKLLYAILGGLSLVFLSQVLLTYYRNLALSQFKIEYERNFFSKFFNHTVLLSQRFYDRHKKEDFINRFSEHLKVRDFFNPAVLEEVIEVFFIPVYLLVLFLFNATLGAIVLGSIVAILLSLWFFTPRLMHLESHAFDEKSKTIGKFLDVISGIQTIKLLHMERLAFWKWKNAYTKSLNRVLDTEKAQININIFSSAISLISQAVVYWYGAFLAFKGDISLGTYVAFITIFTMVISSVFDLKQVWLMISELSVSINKINDIFSEPLTRKNLKGATIQERPVDLTLTGLSFAYSERQESWTLEDINLSIPGGSFVGVVGRNGSGKSTLAKILTGLYPEYEGTITLAGKNIRELKTTSFQKNVAMIPQEIHLFDGTIRENILYANPTASDEQLIRAVNLAGLAGLVRSTFLGLNLMVGEGGSNLSGGQRSRIAFARLFLLNPAIIILDEASSALDIESEKKILGNIRKAFPKTTIISIAHRLNTLRKADIICVLEEGKLVEEGDHATLVKAGGIYQQFIDTYVKF